MTKRTRIALWILGALLAMGGIIAWQWPAISTAYLNHRVDKATVRLPECDRVEIEHLQDRNTVLSQVTLTGTDAEAFAAQWRSQTFGSQYQMMCHEPVFGFKFYKGSTLLFETTVCFHCQNFVVRTPVDIFYWGFDTSTVESRQLLARLQVLFPASIPAQNAK